MSLENLQALSKLSPNSKKYACTTFFKKNMRAASQKKVVHAYFLSLERVWREFGDSPNSFFPLKKKMKNDIKQRFLCEFGVSLEILQARSKLICFHCFLLFHCFFGKEE